MILPRALITAPRIALPDHAGYLIMPSLEGDAVTCPVCGDGRAVAFVEIRQVLPSGEWIYRCLMCAEVRDEYRS